MCAAVWGMQPRRHTRTQRHAVRLPPPSCGPRPNTAVCKRPPRTAHTRTCAWLANTAGIRKCMSDHSSMRSFCVCVCVTRDAPLTQRVRQARARV
jgi:hypothetical protein